MCGIRPEPGGGFTHSLPGPAVQLPGVGFRDFEDLCDVAVAVGECFTQYERGAFGGLEPLHQRQQRNRHRLALLGGFQRTECAIAGDDGLG
jgi:hypothetical protein